MKSQTRFFNSSYRIVLILSILSFLVSACGPTKTPVMPAATQPIPAVSTLAPVNPSPTPGKMSPAYQPIQVVADDIAKDYGVVTQVNDVPNARQIIVFEESHDSPVAQVDIAIMMNRLYANYRMRQISLEGYFEDKGKLDTTWIPQDTPFTPDQNIRAREDVISQLLQDGEISSSEAMALIYNDIKVMGSDIEEEYSYEIPEQAQNAAVIYLYLIASVGMTQDEINKANDLLNANKIIEGVEYIISTDDWASKEYAWLNDTTKAYSTEDYLKFLDDIEAKAMAVNAPITAEDKQNMSDYRKFYVITSNRSKTMVNNTLALSSPYAPIAMVIGAGHTDLVVNQLKQNGVSFAVLHSNMFLNTKNGNLSSAAFDRKTHNQSIDPAGGLGAILDVRKKPQPVIDTTWFQSKYGIYIVADALARKVASGQPPSLDSTIPEFTNVKVDETTIEVINNVVYFKVTASDNNGNPKTVWVGVQADKTGVDRLLEQRLKEGRESDLKKAAPVDGPELTQPKLVPISSVSIAAFGPSKAEVEGMR